ncbi:GntR family transcriptional regulator [Pantoea sp. Ap-967]|uniref:GntR family transcriptional regulator n=1 Tax=Pantoea sp. Ap-967 TaxID=2608362 RepID=UPI00141D862E|nr:GntR family transcriptional regulator [Pantoea sp. Ap-967]
MDYNQVRTVEKRSAEEQVVEILREYILSGTLKAGARITETPLAERLGVARGTLRTGLHKLATEGLVIQTPYIGWQIANLTNDDLWEIWTLRGSLESLAARIVAEQKDPAVFSEIKRVFDAIVQACDAGDAVLATKLDFELHRTIVIGAGHQRLVQQYLLNEQQIRLYIATANERVHSNLSELIEEHSTLVDAILSGNAETAAQAAWSQNENLSKEAKPEKI